MLRSVVWCLRAIDVIVSPVWTRYTKNVGWGVAVGRLNVIDGDGVAGAGVAGAAVCAVADAATGGGVRRPAGCGTHAPAAISTISPARVPAASEGSTPHLLMPSRTAGGRRR